MVVRQRNNEEKVLGIAVDTVWCTHSEKTEQSSTGTGRSFKGIFLWAFRPEILLSNTPVSIVRSAINA